MPLALASAPLHVVDLDVTSHSFEVVLMLRDKSPHYMYIVAAEFCDRWGHERLVWEVEHLVDWLLLDGPCLIVVQTLARDPVHATDLVDEMSRVLVLSELQAHLVILRLERLLAVELTLMTLWDTALVH